MCNEIYLLTNLQCESVGQVKSEVGYVDILINNAGVVSGRKILDCTDAAMRKTMDVNATAHFWVSRSDANEAKIWILRPELCEQLQKTQNH